jgi:hypothetical protein
MALRQPRLQISRQSLAGMLFIVIGALALAYARQYTIGTITRMGPGYFPSVLAITLLLLGLIAVVQSLFQEQVEPLPRPRLLPLAAVTVGITGFGLLVDTRGLLPAVVMLVVCVCHARLRSRPLEVAAIAVSLALITGFLFTRVLILPLRLI